MVFLGVCGLNTLAHARNTAPKLRPSQERQVLDKVQEACNNTWCEGDFVFDFYKFHCEKSDCVLHFVITKYTQYDDGGRPLVQSAQNFPAQCVYSEAKSFGDLVSRSRNYLTNKYFASLALCIDHYGEAIGAISLNEPQPKVLSPASDAPYSPGAASDAPYKGKPLIPLKPINSPDSPSEMPVPVEDDKSPNALESFLFYFQDNARAVPPNWVSPGPPTNQ
jgi:hypothetical protein